MASLGGQAMISKAVRWIKKEWKLLRANPGLLVGLVLLLILRAGMGLYSLNAWHPNSGCKPQEESISGVQSWIYETAMRHTVPIGAAESVRLVTITEGTEPLNVVNNTCDNRLFVADLVKELGQLGAKVIAIDQSYSAGSCNEPTVNSLLSTELEKVSTPSGIAIPVVVGERVQVRRDSTASSLDCLVENNNFDFKASMAPATLPILDNVSFGLLRLNGDLRKIPLKWWVYPNDYVTKKASAEEKDGFAFKAALKANSYLASDRKLAPFLAESEHPYTSFVSTVPTWTAMDILFYGPDKIADSHPEWGTRESFAHVPFDFEDKVVVVGEHIDTDRKPVDGGLYGMDLHAKYIEALLTQSYVGTAPWYLDYGAILVFVILAVTCEALSVRKAADGSDLMDPLRLASWLSAAVVLLGLIAYLVLWLGHLFMPTFLLAFVSMVVSLLGTLFYAFMTAISRGYPMTQKKEAP